MARKMIVLELYFKERTMDDKELVVHEGGLLKPAGTLAELQERYQIQNDFIKSVLKEGVDYGVIPGTNSKPVLLKAGAEKVTTLYGLQVVFNLLDKVEDWTGKDHKDEPFFYYRYGVELKKGDVVVATSEGSANSWEKKYRYRTSELKCPQCELEGTIIKGKEEYGGGWLCWAKKGGCSAKYLDEDTEIVNQERGTVINPNPADVVNTLQKMAQKRALVAAALIAGNVSDHFTQDLEDMDFGVEESNASIVDVDPETGEVLEEEPKPKKKTPAKKAPSKKKSVTTKKGSIKLSMPEHAKDWQPISDFVVAHPDVTGKDMAQLRKENNDDALLVYEYLKENYI